jgi:hypothetical protein
VVPAAALVMMVLAAVASLCLITFTKQKLSGRVSVVVMIMTVRMFLGYIHKHNRRRVRSGGWQMMITMKLRIIRAKMRRIMLFFYRQWR